MNSARCDTERNASRVSWSWLTSTLYLRAIAVASSRASIESSSSPAPNSGSVSEIDAGSTSSSWSASTINSLSSWCRLDVVVVTENLREVEARWSGRPEQHLQQEQDTQTSRDNAARSRDT